MTVRQQLRIWGLILAAFLVLVWLLSDVLLPFVTGLAVAYFLDPAADFLERVGLKRMWATTLITIVFVALLCVSLLLLIPMVTDQFIALVDAWPGYVEKGRTFLIEKTDGRLQEWIASADLLIRESGDKVSGRIVNFGAGVLQSVFNSSLALLNLLGMLFITPVVSFYLLNDWDRMVERIDHLLPRRNADRIRLIAREIDGVLSGFVRGMGSICVILAFFYGIALEIAGLDFGLVVGLISGLVSFIPYVGMLLGLFLSMILAVFQFLPGEPHMVAVILGIFLAGQVLEGNILTPNLVGKNIGLHPVWVIFALLAFGALFGFVGMLLAVPVAAAIGVFARHAVTDYLKSPLYHGGPVPVPNDLLETSDHDIMPDDTHAPHTGETDNPDGQ